MASRARIVLGAADGTSNTALAKERKTSRPAVPDWRRRLAEGGVIGRCMPRHRHREFPKFLKAIGRGTPNRPDIHGIAGNHAARKKQGVKDRLAKHPRFPLRFIPASSSWLNLVERRFGKMTTERIRRGVFPSVPDLERAIHGSIERTNAYPRPFVRTKSAHAIILKVNRGGAALKMPPPAGQDRLYIFA